MNQSSPVNFSGAVDLGALAAANEAKAAATQARQNMSSGNGAAPDGSAQIAGPIVRKLTEQNLREALEISAAVPFIIVFHSTHSENSGKLLQIFEKLAAQYHGRFGLATVSTDEQPAVAQAFGVTAVPAAAALLQGQPIGLFQGLPSETDIAQTVDRVISSAAQYGINGVLDGEDETAGAADRDAKSENQIPPLHQAGLTALEAGDLVAAREAYAQALKENPKDAEAQAALQQVDLLMRVDQLNPQRDANTAQEILARAAQAELSEIQPHLAAADIEMAYSRPDAAFGRLIDVIAATDGKERDLVRERLLSLFETLGSDHELVKQARRALANVLF